MTINFFRGHPSNYLLPNEEIVKATTSLLSPKTRPYDTDNEERHPLTYGSDPGALWVRNSVADLLNRTFALNQSQKSKPEFINLTAGASYGVLNILLQTTLPHTNYTKQAFIITPTYYLINETFVDAGFGGKITAINELDGSIDLDTLEQKLEQLEKEEPGNPKDDLKLINRPDSSTLKKTYKYVIYTIPTFSNPGGETYDLKTRIRLIEIARKYDLLIITDDVYDLLDYAQPLDKLPTPLPRLTHLDRETLPKGNEYGNTISNSTFSKLIAPGLRFGFQESVNDKLVHQLSQGGANVSGGSPAQLNSMIVGTIIKDGQIDGIINNLRKVYSERASVTKQSIEKYLPKGTKAHGFEGGYFIWVTLPEGYDSEKITNKLKADHGVVLASGENFEVVDDENNSHKNKRFWGRRSVRLSVSFLTSEEIEQGIKKWGQVIDELYKKN